MVQYFGRVVSDGAVYVELLRFALWISFGLFFIDGRSTMKDESKISNGDQERSSTRENDGGNESADGNGVNFSRGSNYHTEEGGVVVSGERGELADKPQGSPGVKSDDHEKQSGTVLRLSGSGGQEPDLTVEMHWYSVYVQAGCEGRVIDALKHRIAKSPLANRFGEILLPKVSESGDESKAKKIMPGYIFIQMQMTDETWELVRTTPKVLGFIGGYKNPPPIPEEEIQRLKEIVESRGEVLKERIKFLEGDVVTINEGPFKDFIGKVVQIDEERSKLTVEITIFGRQTPVQVDYSQVTKR
ncbi:MAG: transcription termination/antitermination protein NusG [Thermoplasmatales archaeon]